MARVILVSLGMVTRAVILVTCAPMVPILATRMHSVPKLVRDDSNAGYDSVTGLLLLVLCYLPCNNVKGRSRHGISCFFLLRTIFVTSFFTCMQETNLFLLPFAINCSAVKGK